MLLDFKYHIFTISAIFAALGLGILIGTSIIGQEGLIKEQNNLIERIDRDIKKIRDENFTLTANINKLKNELENRKKMEKKIVTFFLEDVMNGQSYLLYTENYKNSGNSRLEEIKDIFKTAGASLQVINDFDKLKEDKSNNDDLSPDKFNRIIFWNTSLSKEDINKEFKDLKDIGNKLLLSQRNDIMGLLFEIIKSKKEYNLYNVDEKNEIKENSEDNNG